jgi:16S rRNA (guanine527-N7)-methyltransferase
MSIPSFLSDYHLSSHQISQLEKMVDIFLQENEKINLSSFRDKKSVWEYHIHDSLFGGEFLEKKYFPKKTSLRILDFGTGGGFPALPLALLYPEYTFFALDSRKKKIRSVQSIAHVCEMKNIIPLSGRGEELAREKQFRESFDALCTRAAAKFPVLLELVSPFLRVNGLLISYRGEENGKDDILLAKKWHLNFLQKKHYFLSGEKKHTLWVFQKEKPSLSQFPRSVGIPQKKPLQLEDF